MPEKRDDWAIGNIRLSDGSKVYHVYNRLDAQNGPTVYLIQAVSLESAMAIVDCLAEHTV